MDEQNTDSDSQSVTSNHSVSSTSSKQKQSAILSKDGPVLPPRPAQTQSKRKHDDEGKVSSTPKRKKTDAGDPSGAGAVTPGSASTRKAAPLSERQQMALALAMSAQESGGTSPLQTPSQPSTPVDTTPRSAILRKVNRRNEKGESPLHLATIKGDVDGMKRLLKAGAGVNVPDYAGWTGLHEACNHGFVNAAKLLLRKGANVNAQGLDNDTPLHDAAINGHPELVALLLKYGANPHQANSKGESPLDVALNDSIRRLLMGETTFKLASDESDQSASSPETNLPKEEGLDPSSSCTGSAAVPVADSAVEKPAMPPLEGLGEDRHSASAPTVDDKESKQTDVAPVNLSSAAGSKHNSPRASSTGFTQDDCEPPLEAVAARAPQGKLDNTAENVYEETKVKDQVKPVAGDKDAVTEPEEKLMSRSPGLPSKPDSPEGSQPKLLPFLDSPAKSARQSLDFKPLAVPSRPRAVESSVDDTQAAVDTADMEDTDAPFSMSTNIKPQDCAEDFSMPSSNTSETKSTLLMTDVSLPEKMDILSSDVSDLPVVSKSAAAAAKMEAAGESSSTAQTAVLSDYTTPIKDCSPPSSGPAESVKDQEDKDPTNRVPPPSDRKLMDQVKKDAKPVSRPASPAPEKAQRNRTGSMHRKRRQPHPAQSTNQTPDPVVQAEGDNSKDSTDSYMSSGSTTRASRFRNKQQQAVSQQVDEEPIPARETRRKAMLKERAAANSPSAEKLAKSGWQKVPPLTIKLGNKSPASSANPPQSREVATAAPAGGEPYVMLQDKVTEHAKSALAKEQVKEPVNSESPDSKDKKEFSAISTSTQSSQIQSSGMMSSNSQTNTTPSSSGVTTRRTLRSHTNRNQAIVGEKLEDHAPPRKSKRMKAAEPAPITPAQPPSLPPPPGPLTIFNPYNLFKEVRQQMYKKWDRIITVSPRVPTGYSDYLINTRTYLLQKNASTNASKLAIPLLVAPSQLTLPMKELFNKQEHERYKLRQQHIIEGEKLRMSYEQEIVRVYTRGARAAANQETPLSVCTILKDKESGTVYHPFNALKEGNSGQSSVEDKPQNERTSARSHFNNRQLISWLQDSKDKFEKLKDQMLSRHHHEAESLYAVQTMNWEWKLKELDLCDYRSQPTIDMLHVPMVPVNDEADILNSS